MSRAGENRLGSESSPYLRQHKDNPVDWWPWGAAPFVRAQAEDRPILLSIGYSACHWCHVMAHESFEDAETAAQMNRDFINIKVDREEHPDVDQMYQHALQLFGENGGWPLTMFLLPTGEPFYGGTYFPPRDAYGRPSFRRVLTAIGRAYRDDRARLRSQAAKVVEALAELEGRGAGRAPVVADTVVAVDGDGDRAAWLAPDLVPQLVERLMARVDAEWGGFQGAPKFPNPTALSLFLRCYGRTGRRAAAAPALHTLAQMADGGIYDHLGGGFARYSTDEQWLVPHFEKMLYDNAQLLRLYAEAYQIHRELSEGERAERCAQVIRETHGWLERELRDDAGGLYAAQDADSEGVEGKFFVWTPEQIEAVLPPDQARLFCQAYDVRPGGNWQDRHGHAPRGASVLHRAMPQTQTDGPALADARMRLLAARQERVLPGTDDKVLCGWNGMAVTGLAEAGRILGAPQLVAAARRTADFVLAQMQHPTQGLLRTYKAGHARLLATLDDHAFLAEGLIYLAGATGDCGYLIRAAELTDALLARFYDSERGLFFLGHEEADGVRLPVRPVSFYDSAIPSGLSVTCLNLLRLAGLFSDNGTDRGARAAGAGERHVRYTRIADATLRCMVDPATRNPFGLANLGAALDLYRHGMTVTVLVDPTADPADPAVFAAGSMPLRGAALWAAACGCFVPDHFVLRCHPDRPLPDGLDHHRLGKAALGGRATAYVCRGPVCSAPIQDPSELRARLLPGGVRAPDKVV